MFSISAEEFERAISIFWLRAARRNLLEIVAASVLAVQSDDLCGAQGRSVIAPLTWLYTASNDRAWISKPAET